MSHETPLLNLEQLVFDNLYGQLPDEFFDPVSPQPLNNAHLVSFNADAAELIGLCPTQAERDDFVAYINGEKSLPGSAPLAMCYSGHQFGAYVPRLGDGRAILLGQVRNAHGELWDLQIKGAGLTKYSREGDGRAVLRSSIREYLCSEAMHGLGIPTTRALCLINSRERVYRERVEPGALVVRMAQSHVRFGSFEYFYHTGQYHHLKALADYVITHFLPELSGRQDSYLGLLQHAVKSTAALIARWQGVGFAHGVMNSDNMSILGLTIDYGPFGFLDTYQGGFICNHSDHHGRYAFNQQPAIGLFNLSCLATALLPLLAEEKEAAMEIAREALKEYWPIFREAYKQVARNKLGLREAHDLDLKLWTSLLGTMEGQADFTILFRALSGFDSDHPKQNHPLRDMFHEREAFDAWALEYTQRLAGESADIAARMELMQRSNPKYILRNYLAEQAIRMAEDEGDYSEIERLLQLLKHPYDDQPAMARYAAYPPSWAEQISVSCSS
jgi:hypothetical protein